MRARGNKDTSMSFQMRTLRAVFNRAIKLKAVAREKNPFTDYKISRFNTRTPKRALSKTDVMKSSMRIARRRAILADWRKAFLHSLICAGEFRSSMWRI